MCRDWKPENLLLDEDEDLKVSNYGLSALLEQCRSDGMLFIPRGTSLYVSPKDMFCLLLKAGLRIEKSSSSDSYVDPR